MAATRQKVGDGISRTSAISRAPDTENRAFRHYGTSDERTTALRHKRSFQNRSLRDTQSAALVPAPEHRLIVFLVNLRLHAIFKPGFDLTRLCETQHLCGSMPEKLGIGSCQDDADYSPAGLARCCLSTSKMPWPRLRSTRKSLSRHRWKTT